MQDCQYRKVIIIIVVTRYRIRKKNMSQTIGIGTRTPCRRRHRAVRLQTKLTTAFSHGIITVRRWQILNYCTFKLIIHSIQHKIIYTKEMTYLALFPRNLDFILIIVFNTLHYVFRMPKCHGRVFTTIYYYHIVAGLMCGCEDNISWQRSTKETQLIIVRKLCVGGTYVWIFNSLK